MVERQKRPTAKEFGRQVEAILGLGNHPRTPAEMVLFMESQERIKANVKRLREQLPLPTGAIDNILIK